MTIPNIVSGTVTRNASTARRTPSWLKALYAVLITLAVITAIGTVGAILGVQS